MIIFSKRVLVIGHSLLSESVSILVTRCTSYEFSQPTKRIRNVQNGIREVQKYDRQGEYDLELVFSCPMVLCAATQKRMLPIVDHGHVDLYHSHVAQVWVGYTQEELRRPLHCAL